MTQIPPPCAAAAVANPHPVNAYAAAHEGAAALGMQLDIAEQIRRTFSADDYRPPMLPAVVVEVMQLATKPNIDIAEVVETVEKDPVLTARLVRILNSPLYGGAGQIRSIKDAVIRLGMWRLRDFCMEIALNARVFRSRHYGHAMRRVAVHSRATAHLAALLCRSLELDSSQAFLCGLLHDIGIASALLAMGDVDRGEEPPAAELVLQAIGDDHDRYSEKVCQLWGLPAELSMIVGHHHRDSVDGRPQPVSAVVCIADHLADRIGYGIANMPAAPPDATTLLGGLPRGFDSSTPSQLSAARDALDLSNREIQLVLEEGRRKLQGIA